MEKHKSKTEIRHDKILAMLLTSDLVTVSEFCQALNCSEATIRNDLRYLEENGFLKRSYGGAIATGRTAANANMVTRSIAYKPAKEAVGRYIVDNILKPGQTIILDSGTSTMAIAQRIVEVGMDLTVLTNSFPIAAILVTAPSVKLFMTGGKYDPQPGCFHDDLAMALFDTLRADICLISVNGISSETGFTISGFEEAPVKQAMIRASVETYILGDHSKIGKIGLKVIAGLNDVTALVCDEIENQKEFDALNAAGLKMIIVPSQ